MNIAVVGQQGFWQFYRIRLTTKGQRLLDAWCSGDRKQVRLALTNLPHEEEQRDG